MRRSGDNTINSLRKNIYFYVKSKYFPSYIKIFFPYILRFFEYFRSLRKKLTFLRKFNFIVLAPGEIGPYFWRVKLVRLFFSLWFLLNKINLFVPLRKLARSMAILLKWARSVVRITRFDFPAIFSSSAGIRQMRYWLFGYRKF